MKTNLTTKQSISILAIVVIGVLLGASILATDSARHGADEDSHEHSQLQTNKHAGEEHGHDEGHEAEQAKGPHGGKLFKEGDFGLEAVLAEEGGEARFHVYLFNKDRPLPADAAKVAMTLTRPDGKKQEIAFAPAKGYLRSAAAISEPHVFDTVITAQTKDKSYLFPFAQEEGKIELDDDQIKAAGIAIQKASPAEIGGGLTLPGEIQFNEDRTAHVVPRLAGVVEAVRADLGEQVKKGQVLAVIASSGLSEQRSELLSAQKRLALARTTFEREKKLWQEKISAEQDYLQARQAMNEAEIAVRNAREKLNAIGANTMNAGVLNRYEIRAPFNGMVMEKHISLGEALKEDAAIFTISDLSTVWAEFAVPASDLNAVRVGGKATVRASSFDAAAAGRISYVGSLLGEQTRTAKARVVMANPNATWRPGLFVSVQVETGKTAAPVAVSMDAVHVISGSPTIFIRVPGGFLPQNVTLGHSDGNMVEVAEGLTAGSDYAAAGSYILKSELGKASAEHTH